MPTLTELERAYGKHPGEIVPPNAGNKRYNVPPKWYRRADDSVPWGWALVSLPGDAESLMYYTEEKGYTRVPDSDVAAMIQEQEALRADLAAKVKGGRIEEERSKNHPTVIVTPVTQPATGTDSQLTPEEMAEFRAFLASRKKESAELAPESLLEQEAIDTPAKVYACRKCGQSFASPAQVSKHAREEHHA